MSVLGREHDLCIVVGSGLIWVFGCVVKCLLRVMMLDCEFCGDEIL